MDSCRAEAAGYGRSGYLVGELREVFLLDAAQRGLVLGRSQLHRLARELRVEVARVRLRLHLRLEGRRDLRTRTLSALGLRASRFLPLTRTHL